MLTTKPKYEIGEEVEIQGWGGKALGIILDIEEIYHRRLYEYTWGYRIKYIGKDAGLTFVYVPEGYLRRIGEKYLVSFTTYLDKNDNKHKRRVVYSDGSVEIEIIND